MLLYERANFLQQFVVEKLTFLHQGIDATFEPFALVVSQFLGGDHHDSNRSRRFVRFESLEYSKAIHFGHHQVEDHQVGRFLFRQLDGFRPVAGLEDRVFYLEKLVFGQKQTGSEKIIG